MKYTKKQIEQLTDCFFLYEYNYSFDLTQNWIETDDLQTGETASHTIDYWLGFFIGQFENKQHYETPGTYTYLLFQMIIDRLEGKR